MSLPYLTERDGILGVVQHGVFRPLRSAGLVSVTPEIIQKWIFERWDDLLRALAD